MFKGETFEILPAYNSETGCRDLFDEIARCEAEVIRDDGAFVYAYVGAGGREVFVPRGRIRVRMAA